MIAPGVNPWRKMMEEIRRSALTAHKQIHKDERQILPVLEWSQKYLPHYHENLPGRHHFIMSEDLSSPERGRRYLCVAPRESAKSSFISLFDPLRDICEALEPYTILIADTYSQAVKYLSQIKYELENNDLLAADYPEAVGRGDEWSDKGIVTRNGIRVEPLGTGQKIRGRREMQFRPRKIVIDDPQGDEAAYSTVTRDHDWEWFTKGVLKAGDQYTNVHVAATLIHRECIAGKIMRTPGWTIRDFKAIEEWPVKMHLWVEWENILRDWQNKRCKEQAEEFYQRHKSEMEMGARVLWDAREPLHKLMFIRATGGHTAFESEKQNNPIDPSKCEWSPDLFEGDVWFDEWPSNIDATALACDPSKGAQDKMGDYAAFITVKKSGGLFYVDADLERLSSGDIVPRYKLWYNMHRPDVHGLETVMMQELFIPLLAPEVQSGTMLPPIPIEHTIQKIPRIRRIAQFIANKMFRFRRRSPGVQILLQQLMDFPNGDHDDGPDGLEMCMRIMMLLLSGREGQEAFESNEVVFQY